MALNFHRKKQISFCSQREREPCTANKRFNEISLLIWHSLPELLTNQHFVEQTTPWLRMSRMQEGVCWQQARLDLSMCLTDLTFLTAGQVFLLLPHCMSVHISLVSLPPTPFIYACLLCALLLCNKFVAGCWRSPFPPLFFFPVFPTLCAPQETRPLLASVHLAVKLAEGPTCAWAHNKIIFALGCWNSADTSRQFHLPWKRGKKREKSGTDMLSLSSRILL